MNLLWNPQVLCSEARMIQKLQQRVLVLHHQKFLEVLFDGLSDVIFHWHELRRMYLSTVLLVEGLILNF